MSAAMTKSCRTDFPTALVESVMMHHTTVPNCI
jgi:hypothetical protein